MFGGTVKQQPLYNRLSDFVPSAVQQTVLKSPIEEEMSGGTANQQASDNNPDVFAPSAVEKPQSHNNDGTRFAPSGSLLTDEDLKELIDDPENESKAFVFKQEDVQQNAMQTGLCGAYKEGEQFTVLSDFGRGGYGKAQWIKDKTTNHYLIRKEIKKCVFKTKEIVAVKDINKERYFPTLFGIMPHNNSVSIFMQYGGFSFNKLVTNPQFRSLLADENNIMEIARQGFSALIALEGLIHMDIKPENLCLSWTEGHLCLMICDFGSCVMGPISNRVTMSGWTTAYMAPEMCRFVLSKMPGCKHMWEPDDMKISTKVDVYSFALSLLYLIYWKHWQEILVPDWREKTSIYLQSFIATSDPSKLHALIKPEFDKRLKEVLQGALSVRPSERITPCKALDILSDPVMPADLLVGISPSSCAIVSPVNSSGSRKRRSGDSQKGNASSLRLNALQISYEPPEKCQPDDQGQSVPNESLPGNMPNLPVFLEN